MRNVLAHAGRSGRRVASPFIATAFAQDDAEAARQQSRRVAYQLRRKVPKLATLMDTAELDVLAYMGFPAAHRVKLQSTNPLWSAAALQQGHCLAFEPGGGTEGAAKQTRVAPSPSNTFPPATSVSEVSAKSTEDQ